MSTAMISQVFVLAALIHFTQALPVALRLVSLEKNVQDAMGRPLLGDKSTNRRHPKRRVRGGPTNGRANAFRRRRRLAAKAKPRPRGGLGASFVSPIATAIAQPARYLRSLSPSMLMPLPPLCCSCRSKLTSCQLVADGRRQGRRTAAFQPG